MDLLQAINPICYDALPNLLVELLFMPVDGKCQKWRKWKLEVAPNDIFITINPYSDSLFASGCTVTPFGGDLRIFLSVKDPDGNMSREFEVADFQIVPLMDEPFSNEWAKYDNGKCGEYEDA